MAHSTTPISNILKSSIVKDYLASDLEEVFIGDFGSGRNAEVPIFFVKEYQHLVSHRVPNPIVYSIDMHTLRLENMFGQFLEEEIQSNARVVYAKLESMNSHATFPYEQKEYLKRNLQESTSLDKHILNEENFPPTSLHLGIMNKDLIGYLSEYYENESDLRTCLQAIKKILHLKALLIITQPCVMYRVDNVKLLRDNGFHLEEIIDVDLKTELHTLMDVSASIESFSKPNHYSFIVASCK